jgi:outer membrane protein assembly factor BamA
MVQACNTIKYLKPGEELYAGADVKVISVDRVNEKQIRKQMEKVLRPKPNQTIGGVRFKLWFYDIAGEAPKKGFKKWLKNELGEKPVLYDQQIPIRVSDIITNRLNNLGYYDARVRYSVTSKERKVKVHYEATVTKPYTISEIIFPKGDDVLTYKISETYDESLLKSGSQYNLDVIRNERARIDLYLKNEGYYFFNPDYLLFKADSTKGNKMVALKLTVKKDIPYKARMRYVLDDIYIFPSYRMRDTSRTSGDTLKLDGYSYITRDSTFHPRAVTRSVFLKKGEFYNRRAYSTTVNRLMGMGVFSYVNVRFDDTIVNDQGHLKAFIYLTPTQKRSVQLEVEAVTKSNNYTGPALTVSWKNRNLLRGAELFIFNFNTNYETQFTGVQKGLNSYEVGANTQLFLPKFATPFRINNVSSTFLPRTKFDLGFRNLNRVQYFNMNAFNFTFGYNWKESSMKEHELNPVVINFARLKNTTATFDELLAINPFLKKSFEQQFTIGGSYAFTYNSLLNNIKKKEYYFKGMLEVSGNAISLIQKAATGKKPSEEDPFKILGYRYSQYAKVSTDTRYYLTINANSRIATRVIAGVGLPYGNSNELPYLKQFFSGGSNSIRAFLPRTVGPGIYRKPDSLLTRTFLDQAGDLKLEGSVEYRFTIISVLKGALFLDAGNVWLLNKNDLRPGGEFNPNLFYKQFAVGTGFGLRLDVTFFVLRIDLGMPLRKPYLPLGQRWVTDEIDFGNTAWRKQNLVLNIAIGYPF